MNDFEENAIEWLTGQKRAGFTATQKKWVNKLKKYAESHPDDVDVYVNKDGSVFAHVPVSWIKVSPPRAVNLTEEQKAEAAERLRKAREKKNEES